MLRNIVILTVMVVIGAVATYVLDYSAPMTMASKNVEKRESGIAKNQPVPSFTFIDLNGQERKIEDFQGKTVVLNFWASWCAPCVKEFPLFLQLAKAYPEDVVFIGLSSDHKKSDMDRFLVRLRKEYSEEMALDNVIIAMDEKAQITAGLFQTYRLPETIIIDDKGLIKAKLIGADWLFGDLEELVVN